MMRAAAMLLVCVGCAAPAPTHDAIFRPTTQTPVATAPAATFVLTPGYVGDDVDLSKMPPAPVTPRVIPMRHSGRPRTTFRVDDGVVVITASADADGRHLEAARNGSHGCGMPPPPIHRTRALTEDEWRHLVWLVNIAEVERLPLVSEARAYTLAEAMRGRWTATFAMSSPEGEAHVCVEGPNADALQYAIRYMEQLAGDGF